MAAVNNNNNIKYADESISTSTSCTSESSVLSRKRFFASSAHSLSFFALASIGIGSTCNPQAAFAKDGIPKTGAKAPEFDLPNSRSQGNLSSDDLLSKTGKWTVLYFYPGAFTSGCTLEARGFQRDIELYRKLNAQIVGVSVDSVEKNAQFCTEEQLDFIMLTDEGGKVSKSYGSALSIPGFGTFSNRQTYLIDPDGNVQHVFADVESHVARHSAEVLEKLKELQA